MHSRQDSPSDGCGTLFVVATPIGNLEDITFRAVRILKQVFLIAAEDTRHARKLLSHYDILTPTVSCHEHNEAQKAEKLISVLQQGNDIALITDAGTPCISDPGYRLITTVLEQGISVVPIPGCCAITTGLSVAGLPTDRFLFAGFLPRKPARQAQAVQALSVHRATLVFYESPRRIRSLLDQLQNILGDRRACLAREITKLHEVFIRGPLSHVAAVLDAGTPPKGECTLFVAGAGEPEKISSRALEALIREQLNQSGHRSTADLANELSMQFRISKKQVYDTIVKLKSD
jgi:16S rRNA (cytidine1402-2'-O)-methyltransferase